MQTRSARHLPLFLLVLSAFGCRESAKTSPELATEPESKKGTAAADDLCSTLARQWAATSSAAKKCSVDAGSPACSRSFDDDIGGCGKTFVDEANRGEITELEAMSKSWVSLGCKSKAPCPPGAKAPPAAACVAGQCSDQL